MRVFRIWCDLQARKHAGFGHDPELANAGNPGSLVLYCPSCPQPGVNLPEGWQNEKDAQWKYARVLNMDGNFKADHLSMNTPNDISLSDGLGFFVGAKQYAVHIKKSTDSQVSFCVFLI